MAKDPCDYEESDDHELGEYRVWIIQKACDPEISASAREAAKNWFHVIEEVADHRKKIIKELLQ